MLNKIKSTARANKSQKNVLEDNLVRHTIPHLLNEHQEKLFLNSTGLPGKGIAYLRSASITDGVLALETQLRDILTRAEGENVEIVKVFTDVGVSSYKHKYFPGFSQLLDAAKHNPFEFLYIDRLDRLSRRFEWAIELMRELQASNIKVIATAQNFDLNARESRLAFHLLSAHAELLAELPHRKPRTGTPNLKALPLQATV